VREKKKKEAEKKGRKNSDEILPLIIEIF